MNNSTQKDINIPNESENHINPRNIIKNTLKDCAYCICPICGEKVFNIYGLICHEVHCPICKSLMIRY